MSKKVIKISIIVLGIVLLSVYAVNRVILFFQIDSCLDRGGSWNYERNECEFLNREELGQHTDFYWYAEFDSLLNKEYLERGKLIDTLSLAPSELIGILNEREIESKIEYIKQAGDTLHIRILNDQVLSEQMGSSGAYCFLGETVYTLTENDAVVYVNIHMDYGSHASPGNYSRNDFKDLITNRNLRIIGAWGTDEIGNARFAFYSDSIYYPDPHISYKYEINYDTILIHRGDNFVQKMLILKLTPDSLFLSYPEYGLIDSLNRRKD